MEITYLLDLAGVVNNKEAVKRLVDREDRLYGNPPKTFSSGERILFGVMGGGLGLLLFNKIVRLFQ